MRSCPVLLAHAFNAWRSARILLWNSLALLVGSACERVESGLALAQHQQHQGLFAAAHAQLLKTLCALKQADERPFRCARTLPGVIDQQEPQSRQQQIYAIAMHRFALLHSYLLVPRLLKQGDQYTASLLLTRVSAYIAE